MKIPFHKACIGEEEIEEVVKVIRSGWLTMGPKTIEFEDKFKEYIGSSYAISMNSATAALHLALKAIGISSGDEVIIPTNTFISTAEVITYLDAKPVLCDIEEGTHNIDCEKIERLITERTKAIMPVHFAGQPCDMDEIKNIAKDHNLKVIEDAAHTLPSSYKGKKVGTLSDITCFSFYATKPLTTGEGGMVTTNNENYAKKIKVNRLHGISRDAWDRYTEKGSWYYEVIDNGNKYNTTDINSALGIIQLKKLELMSDKRYDIARRYNDAFIKANIEVPAIKDNRSTSWHVYFIKVNNRNELIELLKEEGIVCSVHFIPVHKHPYYKSKYGYNDEDYPIANKIFNRVLSLPIYPDMSCDEVDYVIEKVLKYAK